MGKFCSNCGVEVMGKFCSNCGKAIDNLNQVSEDDKIRQLNGVPVDIGKILSIYGAKGQIQTSKYLRELTGASLKECVKFASDICHDENLTQQMLEKENILESKLQSEKVLFCPKCHSTSVSVNKKGFGLGKSALGLVALGPVGLLGGLIGANKLKATCLHCGNEFKIKN